MTTPPFDVKKNLEESIKEGLVITGATVEIFWLLKMGKTVSPPKTALDASDIIKLSGGIITGALLKDYAVYKKWMLKALFKRKYVSIFFVDMENFGHPFG